MHYDYLERKSDTSPPSPPKLSGTADVFFFNRFSIHALSNVSQRRQRKTNKTVLAPLVYVIIGLELTRSHPLLPSVPSGCGEPGANLHALNPFYFSTAEMKAPRRTWDPSLPSVPPSSPFPSLLPLPSVSSPSPPHGHTCPELRCSSPLHHGPLV